MFRQERKCYLCWMCLLVFMYEYCHNTLPPSFHSMFIYNCGINTLRKTRQSDLNTSNIANLHLHKSCLSIFPTVWHNWITTTINVKSKSQFKQVIMAKMLASYSNSVRCANLQCTDCHGQSVYSNYVEDHLVLVNIDLVKLFKL